MENIFIQLNQGYNNLKTLIPQNRYIKRIILDQDVAQLSFNQLIMMNSNCFIFDGFMRLDLIKSNDVQLYCIKPMSARVILYEENYKMENNITTEYNYPVIINGMKCVVDYGSVGIPDGSIDGKRYGEFI
jgi:hypothetical protein